jgi:hypothetical protein
VASSSAKRVVKKSLDAPSAPGGGAQRPTQAHARWGYTEAVSASSGVSRGLTCRPAARCGGALTRRPPLAEAHGTRALDGCRRRVVESSKIRRQAHRLTRGSDAV